MPGMSNGWRLSTIPIKNKTSLSWYKVKLHSLFTVWTLFTEWTNGFPHYQYNKDIQTLNTIGYYYTFWEESSLICTPLFFVYILLSYLINITLPPGAECPILQSKLKFKENMPWSKACTVCITRSHAGRALMLTQENSGSRIYEENR